jgi:hypothetical protein
VIVALMRAVVKLSAVAEELLKLILQLRGSR